MLGDILIANLKLLLVLQDEELFKTPLEKFLPEEFQTAEYVKEHGGIDLVIERQYLNSTVGTLLKF